MNPICCAWVLQGGLLATVSIDFCGPLFLGRFLVEIQTMTNMCSFRKRAHLPLLEHTADNTSYNMLNDLPGAILLSSVVQGDQRAAQLGLSDCVSWEAFFQEPNELRIGCVATS